MQEITLTKVAVPSHLEVAATFQVRRDTTIYELFLAHEHVERSRAAGVPITSHIYFLDTKNGATSYTLYTGR